MEHHIWTIQRDCELYNKSRFALSFWDWRMLIEGRERLIRCFRRKLFETRLYLETKYFEICYFSMFDFKSAEISEDGETFMPIMAPPGQISIECDQSDTDHVCLGPWLYYIYYVPWTTNFTKQIFFSIRRARKYCIWTDIENSVLFDSSSMGFLKMNRTNVLNCLFESFQILNNSYCIIVVTDLVVDWLGGIVPASL